VPVLGRQTGADVALPAAAVVARRRDGLVVYFKAYLKREDALEPIVP
jgi:hypothetical protein